MEARGSVRRAAVSDRFYPGDPVMLSHVVERYVDRARASGLRRVRAVVAPHAAYVCSGPVAGFSFRALREGARPPEVLYLLGPAHWGGVRGAGLPRSEAFETPLGVVDIAQDRVEALITQGRPFEWAEASHVPEHCLEVELPFLQRTFPPFRIVPVLLGRAALAAPISEALAPALEGDDGDLLVVSSDLSHHLPDSEARERDGRFLQDVLEGKDEDLDEGQACGLCGIRVLMHLARRLGWTPHLLAYGTSGDTCGPKSGVVGYASIAYTA